MKGTRERFAYQATAMTVEADPVDWAEQHDVVPLPDDEYPHAGDDALVSASGRFAGR
ncbi:hypothetical protein OK015_00280 [Mycobacterium sp. Aquia_216]|uniref:hypothetical protein n=1 Tax=Mycobacterium sp. Aquia_216 TaxID=2991729 RepID=UPI00227B427D|nr:hypothetical protein [Mycobacterium sp. Aquia_216]WAJ45017.1 hypothetical protein OK015_00280 [Mycobacterium sp. Aquia_216]